MTPAMRSTMRAWAQKRVSISWVLSSHARRRIAIWRPRSPRRLGWEGRVAAERQAAAAIKPTKQAARNAAGAARRPPLSVVLMGLIAPAWVVGGSQLCPACYRSSRHDVDDMTVAVGLRHHDCELTSADASHAVEHNARLLDDIDGTADRRCEMPLRED